MDLEDHMLPYGSSYLNSRLLGYIIWSVTHYLGNWSPRVIEGHDCLSCGQDNQDGILQIDVVVASGLVQCLGLGVKAEKP